MPVPRRRRRCWASSTTPALDRVRRRRSSRARRAVRRAAPPRRRAGPRARSTRARSAAIAGRVPRFRRRRWSWRRRWRRPSAAGARGASSTRSRRTRPAPVPRTSPSSPTDPATFYSPRRYARLRAIRAAVDPDGRSWSPTTRSPRIGSAARAGVARTPARALLSVALRVAGLLAHRARHLVVRRDPHDLGVPCAQARAADADRARTPTSGRRSSGPSPSRETPIGHGNPPPVTSSRSTFALMFPWSPGTKNGAVPRSASLKSIVTFDDRRAHRRRSPGCRRSARRSPRQRRSWRTSPRSGPGRSRVLPPTRNPSERRPISTRRAVYPPVPTTPSLSS